VHGSCAYKVHELSRIDVDTSLVSSLLLRMFPVEHGHRRARNSATRSIGVSGYLGRAGCSVEAEFRDGRYRPLRIFHFSSSLKGNAIISWKAIFRHDGEFNFALYFGRDKLELIEYATFPKFTLQL